MGEIPEIHAGPGAHKKNLTDRRTCLERRALTPFRNHHNFRGFLFDTQVRLPYTHLLEKQTLTHSIPGKRV